MKTPAPTIFNPVGPPRFTDIYNPNPNDPINAGVSLIVDDQMINVAGYFYRMWLKADTQKARVP